MTITSTTTNPSTHLRVAVLAGASLVAALTLSACSSSGNGGNTTANTAAGSSTPVPTSSAAGASSGSAAGGGGASSGKTVTADETEFSIKLSTSTLTPGSYTFTAHNSGKIVHALTVDGPGVEDKSTGAIQAGADGKVTVTLKAGTYDVYCPVGNHKMEGMDVKVKVA